ncbi:MAG TPA: FecR family protein [Bacteroidales bacterium]|nr:FecR family protein [Bacteroidales bacterium]HQG37240.1 FecR family protein [Bacteroidales bacterium]HQG53767.1 FecR family protein [Bacteroidales bacterium]HQJ21498.1 FecR family protein [Bacteroidales bacterium]
MNIEKFDTETDELLVKYLTGNASEDECAEAKEWINKSDENRKYFEHLKFVYIAAKGADMAEMSDIDTSWERVKARHYRNAVEKANIKSKKELRSFVIKITSYAALITLLISLTIIFQNYFRYKKVVASSEVWNTVEAPYGSRVRLTLADGSKVWLNAGSNLKYQSSFGQINRKVVLEGEAYFDVVKDSSLQFVVNTKYLDVKVYGTEFNVKAYSDEDIVETTLVNGSIELEGRLLARAGKRSVKLEPNQTAIFYVKERLSEDTDNNTILKEKHLEDNKVIEVTKNLEIKPDVNTIIYTSWKDPVWYIESESLESLAEKFERRYNIKFEFKDENLKNYRFTGKLKDETLEQVLLLMKLSAPIEYQIENNKVIISENKYFKKSYDEMLVTKRK